MGVSYGMVKEEESEASSLANHTGRKRAPASLLSRAVSSTFHAATMHCLYDEDQAKSI